MSLTPVLPRRLLSALLLAFAVACGGSGDATSDSAVAARAADSATAPSSAAAASSGAASSEAAPLAFTDADLDAFERGMAREAQLVRESKEKERTAATPAERGAATQSGWEDSTIPEGAKAAGMDVARYRQLRATLNDVLQILDFQGKIDGPLQIDTARVGAEMKAKLAGDPLTTLSPASAAALRARLDRTVKAWVEYTTLVAVSG